MEIVFLAEKRNAPVLPVVGKSCQAQPWVESASACETFAGHAGSLVGNAIRLYGHFVMLWLPRMVHTISRSGAVQLKLTMSRSKREGT
jgi:hypothetical protein